MLSRYTTLGSLVAMDVPSHLVAAAAGVIAGASLSEATEPLVRTIGGWASFGGAALTYAFIVTIARAHDPLGAFA